MGDKQILAKIDEALVEIYNETENKSLFDVNYSGAKIAISIIMNPMNETPDAKEIEEAEELDECDAEEAVT